MACEVFKIVNNMSPYFITILIEIKTSKYSIQQLSQNLKRLNMDLNPSHTRVSGYGTVYRMNYDGVTTLGNFVDCSDAGTVPCVDARLVDSR